MKSEGKNVKNKAASTVTGVRRTAPYPPLFTPHAAMAIAAVIAIAGCGTTVPRPDGSLERSPSAASAPSTAPRGGGYYLDDGPGDNPPADLASVPDAVPRLEPMHRGAARPYVVMGREYTPMTRLAPYKARGIASWYGRRYHGKPTSSGEIYDMYGMTAAHPVLPIPSFARVTNVRDGRSVIVRINDRGPFLSDRLIDLSYTAAYKLGVLAGGSALVDVEAITPDMFDAIAATPKAGPTPASATAPAAVIAALSAAPEPEIVPLPPQAPAPAAAASGVYLQLGAFGSRENAESYLARLRAQAEWLADRLQVLLRDGYYRVHAGPYDSTGEARAASDRIVQALGMRPLLVNR